MKCPYCSWHGTKVVDKRDIENLELTRRRRECLKCERRFTTYERVAAIDITILKKDGRKEPFDREKIMKGLLRALEKRPFTREQIEGIADDIESSIRKKKGTHITSTEIGKLILKELKELDLVAYIRFASVHQEFSNLESFEDALRELQKKRV